MASIFEILEEKTIEELRELKDYLKYKLSEVTRHIENKKAIYTPPAIPLATKTVETQEVSNNLAPEVLEVPTVKE